MYARFVHAGLTRDRIETLVGSYASQVRRFTPHLAEELAGIAEGSGISLTDAYALQTRFELTYTARPECTVLGVTGGRSATGWPLIAQNIDLSPDDQHSLAVLHMRFDDGPEVLTLSLAGLLSQEGLNSYGMGLCGSLVVSEGWASGFPNRNFLRRHILEQATFTGAEDALSKMLPRAASHHVMLAAGTDVASLEQTPDQHRWLAPENGWITHTNHYQHAELRRVDALSARNPSLFAGSIDRLARANELMATHQGTFTPSDLRAVLSDHDGAHPICRHYKPDLPEKTVASVVIDAAAGRMEVTVGEPCRSAPITYQLVRPPEQHTRQRKEHPA